MNQKNLKNSDQKTDKGHVELLAGAGLGAYGGVLALGSGFICPACLVIAPGLLAWGGIKKYKSLMKEKSLRSSPLDTKEKEAHKY